MNLYDYNTIKSILEKHGFSFSKSLGQNFIIEESICPRMADALLCDKKTGVIEIGPGIGVLTKELSLGAGKVVSIELDKRLPDVLKETLCDCDNVKIINDDIMELDIKKLIEDEFCDMNSVKVCANLPYYITSPLIMRLLSDKLPISDIVVMVQKEAAIRLCADVSSREAGAVTAAVAYRAIPSILFDVTKDCFMPSPKVDSAVIKLTLRDKPPVDVKDEKAFFKLIKASFAQRRKTLVNSVSNSIGIKSANIVEALESLDLDKSIRAEKLTLEDFARLSDILF